MLTVTNTFGNAKGKIVLSLPIVAIFYLVLLCPCKGVLKCHVTQTYALVALFVALVIAENGFTMTNVIVT